MTSIRGRLLVANALVLLPFMVLLALSLSWAVQKRAEEALDAQLRGMVFAVLGVTESDAAGNLSVNDVSLPDSMFGVGSPSIQATVYENGQRVWQSLSSSVVMPKLEPLALGSWHFSAVDEPRNAYQLQFSTAWVVDSGREVPFVVQLLDHSGSLAQEQGRFRRMLAWILFAVAAVLLMLQAWVLVRALAPLSRAGREAAAIEQGEADKLTDPGVSELRPLTLGLNALLDSERARQERFRHLVDDLAHTLRTPLTVLTNLGSPDAASTTQLQATVSEQTQMMRDSIERTVTLARQEPTRYLGSAVELVPLLQQITRSLTKLYRDQAPEFAIDLQESVAVRVDAADLYQIFGNLLDNACRYGASTIHIAALDQHDESSGRVGIAISDSGPGFDSPDPQALVERGARADLQVAGDGTGLASCRQLLARYGGVLQVGNGGALGGACVKVWMPR